MCIDKNRETKNLLLLHRNSHPDMQINDLFKFIFHSAFGCEHLISSPEAVEKYIKEEYKKGVHDEEIETLDGDFVRVPLSYLGKGLSTETLAKIFYLSAKEEKDSIDEFKRRLAVAGGLVREGYFSFGYEEFSLELQEWEEKGFLPVHHSEKYRQTYSPAYRVISKKYAPYIPLFCACDNLMKKGSISLAVEGRCASGKTTLGAILEKVYDCTLFHLDDFFLRPEQRTKERYAEVGGNIDRERFLSEVLLPLQDKQSVIEYRKFDCSTSELTEKEKVEIKPLTVIEGVYSMHTDLAPYYDFSVFLSIDSDLQKKRIEKRNSPEMAARFFDTWIPLEEKYFKEMHVRERCNLVINIE